MFGLKMSELLIILVIVMLLFGTAKLPQLGSSIGQAIRNFKKGFGEEPAPPESQPRPPEALGTKSPESSSPARSAAPVSKDG
jgi:TatA/E family protein of Tat protein translocase